MPKKKNTRRDDGLIAVQVYLGRKPDGKRNYKTVYGHSQAEANEKADLIKLKLKKGLDISAENDTFGEWADRWLKVKTGENLTEGRIVVLECHVKHLKRYLENIPIAKIKMIDIQGILIDLAKKNPNTGKPMVKDTLSTLRNTCKNIFQLAIDNRVMEFNPALSVKIPESSNTAIIDEDEYDENKRRALTDDEQQWILDTPHRAKCAAMVMMYSGLRRGELIPLTWNDIDLKNRTISVNKTVKFVKNKAVQKRTAKTDKSLRSIKIPMRLVNFLKEENANKQSIYVCPAASGAMHTEASFRSMWESYLCDLNFRYGDFSPFEKQPKSKFDHGTPFVIPNITPHWLRHTFATMMYLAGVDVREAMRQLGHKDIRTTMNIYTHLDEKYKEKSIDKLDEYLDGASSLQVVESK